MISSTGPKRSRSSPQQPHAAAAPPRHACPPRDQQTSWRRGASGSARTQAPNKTGRRVVSEPLQVLHNPDRVVSPVGGRHSLWCHRRAMTHQGRCRQVACIRNERSPFLTLPAPGLCARVSRGKGSSLNQPALTCFAPHCGCRHGPAIDIRRPGRTLGCTVPTCSHPFPPQTRQGGNGVKWLESFGSMLRNDRQTGSVPTVHAFNRVLYMCGDLVIN